MFEWRLGRVSDALLVTPGANRGKGRNALWQTRTPHIRFVHYVCTYKMERICRRESTSHYFEPKKEKEKKELMRPYQNAGVAVAIGDAVGVSCRGLVSLRLGVP